MNGNVTKEVISLDLKAMKEAGIGGFQLFHEGIFPPGPVKYNSFFSVFDSRDEIKNESAKISLENYFNVFIAEALNYKTVAEDKW